MKDLRQSKILITGGAGFVGSFVVDQLLAEGVERIIIIDNMIRGKRKNIEKAMASGRVTLVEGDIRDEALLDKYFENIDYCFHLAALRITHCAAEPRQALEVMYTGTFNVLEACVKHQIKRIVFSSTASIYGQALEFPTKEEHNPYHNYTLYGAAKMADELMLRSFERMYGLEFNVLRYFNIYGPRMDTHGKYTEVLIRWYHLIKEGKPPLIFGEGNQTMDFIYVEEIARATILALKADVSNEVFNIAEGKEVSLKELCESLLKVMDAKLEPKYIPMPEERNKVEVMRRCADVSKAKEFLGFTSQVGLNQGLKQLVDWIDLQNSSEDPSNMAMK